MNKNCAGQWSAMLIAENGKGQPSPGYAGVDDKGNPGDFWPMDGMADLSTLSSPVVLRLLQPNQEIPVKVGTKCDCYKFGQQPHWKLEAQPDAANRSVGASGL